MSEGIGLVALVALFLGEARRSKAVFKLHLPDSAESDGNMIRVEWGCSIFKRLGI